MFLFKKRKSNLDSTLRNFLSYLLEKRDSYVLELSHEYSLEERYDFIYNCALNTIDEYINSYKNYNQLFISTKSLIRLFKENFMLRQFERNDISVNISKKTESIIKEFGYLKSSLSNSDKNYIIQNVNDIIASAV